MKRNFWLILAVLALLGMLIMPGTAHSAELLAPKSLPTISAPRVILPNYPVPMGQLSLSGVRLTVPTLPASLITAAVPAPAVAESAPVILSRNPADDGISAPVIISPQSVIPSSRIEGIAAGRKVRKGITSRIGKAIAGLGADNKEKAQKLTALFDGAAQAEPAAVPAAPVTASPEDVSEDTSLTLPESDLADEIGLGGLGY